MVNAGRVHMLPGDARLWEKLGSGANGALELRAPVRALRRVRSMVMMCLLVAASLTALVLITPSGRPAGNSLVGLAPFDDEWEVIWLDVGPSHTQLEPDRNYVVILPAVPKQGHTILEGGHHVVIRGGHIQMDGQGSDLERRALYIKNATGTVELTDIYIEGVGDGGFDAIAISAPEAVVQLNNIRVEGVRGTFAGFHGDIVQPFGGVRKLVVNGLTGRSSYQGFYLQETQGEIGSVELHDVDLAYDDNPEDETTYLLWFGNCPTYPVTLRNVYIKPRAGQRVGTHAVRPNVVRPERCQAIEVSGEVWWPEAREIDGSIIVGEPPGGDFVPLSLWENG